MPDGFFLGFAVAWALACVAATWIYADQARRFRALLRRWRNVACAVNATQLLIDDTDRAIGNEAK